MKNNKEKYLKQCLDFIPACSQTLSKNPDQYVLGVSPLTVKKASDVYIWDSENKKYLDFVMALGPMIFGYAHKEIDATVKKQISKGTIFSLPSELELSLAKTLREIIPCAEMSRFGLNGSDVTTAAIRLSRHLTGRDHIAKCGYHGWQDWSIGSKVGRNNGVPRTIKKLTHDFIYNQPDSLEKIFKSHPRQIAAVILEPVSAEKPKNNFLLKVKTLAKKHGAILIFDELVTGFRWSLGGAQEYFGIVPDLACFGKAIGGGYPISALCGRKKYMRHLDEIFFSMTFAGFVPALAAAIKTISLMRRHKNMHRRLHDLGQYLIKNANVIIAKYNLPLYFTGYGPHPVMQINITDNYLNRLFKTFIYQEMSQVGILFNSSLVISFAHNKSHIDFLLKNFEIICKKIKAVGDNYHNLEKQLIGPVVKPRTVRNIQ